MRTKATQDLTALPDDELFQELSKGLGLVAKNVSRLADGSSVLAAEGRRHTARVLEKVAEEEAGKFLILVDAARCPRRPQVTLATHLRRFSDHLAKGLYAKACMYRPSTLRELQEYLDLDRPRFYLDGPNGVEWSFPNEVTGGREGLFYVDYQDRDGEYHWTDPAACEDLLCSVEPMAVRVMRQLDGLGVTTVAALRTIAEVWRPAEVSADMRWSDCRALSWKTCEVLNDRGQLNEHGVQENLRVVDYWPFPMFGLDLRPIDTKIDDLRELQRNWVPPGFYDG